MHNKPFSVHVNVFHERKAPEGGYLAGYSALINTLSLKVPLPDRLALISSKHRKYETEEWMIFTPRYQPEESLGGHLIFALKYEPLDLGILKTVFQEVGQTAILEVIQKEPTGQYSRKIWFLYEWLLNEKFPLPDLTTSNYIELVNESMQFTGTTEISKRHRVKNNLPGVSSFCPMIRKTPKLLNYIAQNFPNHIQKILGKIHPDVMARAAAFLLLKDSRASYAIEGERPPQNRAQRWGRAIGQAGQKPLSKDELIRLQQIVIDNPRFTKMGWREQEGFVGEHDRKTGVPIPDHISAKWTDINSLIEGLIETNLKLEDASFDAVIAAALVAFGFVFIHPFVDGNGRIHRYLIHHVLLHKDYVPKGIIFPVSSVILERLEEYRQVLETFSLPRLELIEWKISPDNNIEILNETADLYRYFDATKQAEFLYSCVEQTVKDTIPQEVNYLQKYDRMKAYVDDFFDMPDKMVSLLVRFLEQGNGKLSERTKAKEFAALTEKEAIQLENKYAEIFSEE
ncbi:MAG: Fic family protein [Segetibacter sp.]